MKTQLFKEHLNPVFVETGTFKGDGVIAALAAGFKRIITIEAHGPYYLKVKNAFAGDDKVEFWWGDSSQILFDVIEDIDCKMTFWLDGHYNKTAETEAKRFPLLDELEQIKRHRIHEHTLMIDDTRYLDKPVWDYLSLKDVKKLIFSINEKYSIYYSSIVKCWPKDVLIAEVPLWQK